ncbi:HutD/Ves family protein [Pseudarthrobacter sp. O4]|uniref:HutD/Ves family protein n=1 Tax=Pseudarthrobacter sp. O4 TaxID=3418417 RepID=UPI003CEFA7C6
MTGPSDAQVVLPLDLPQTAWANGAGHTREISVSTKIGPERFSDRRSADYQWRLSLAELTRAANFSMLPGIDRVFTLASQGPLAMTVDGVERILWRGQRVEFTGEVAVRIELASPEPQLGLNLMTRRGSCTGWTSVQWLNGKLALDPSAGVAAVTVLAGTVLLSDGRKLTDLATLVLDVRAEEIEAEACLLAITTVRRL